MKRLFLIFFLFVVPLFARIERFADLAGASYNKKQIDGQILLVNGVATHRRFVFDIYQLSLFVKIPTHNPDEILNSHDLMYAQMKFLRNLEAKDIKDGFQSTFDDNCAPDCDELKGDLKKLLDAIPDMNENENIAFTFYPERTDITSERGISLSFPDAKFGHFFLKAWLGDNPPSERFKNELLDL